MTMWEEEKHGGKKKKKIRTMRRTRGGGSEIKRGGQWRSRIYILVSCDVELK